MSTFWLSLFRPILNFGSFKLIQTVLSTFGVIRAHLGSYEFIRVISLQFYEKNFKCNNICFVAIIQFIFWQQCEIHQCQFKIPLFFCILFSIDRLEQSRFDFSNPKQTFVRIQLLEIDYGRSLFSDSFVPDTSKTFGSFFPYYR